MDEADQKKALLEQVVRLQARVKELESPLKMRGESSQDKVRNGAAKPVFPELVGFDDQSGVLTTNPEC